MNVRQAIAEFNSEALIVYLNENFNFNIDELVQLAFPSENNLGLFAELFKTGHTVEVFETIFNLLGKDQLGRLLTTQDRIGENLLHQLALHGNHGNRPEVHRLDQYLIPQFAREYQIATLQENSRKRTPIRQIFEFGSVDRVPFWLKFMRPERMVLAVFKPDADRTTVVEYCSHHPELNSLLSTKLKSFKTTLDHRTLSLSKVLSTNLDKNESYLLAYLELLSTEELDTALSQDGAEIIQNAISFYQPSVLKKLFEKASDRAILLTLKNGGLAVFKRLEKDNPHLIALKDCLHHLSLKGSVTAAQLLCTDCETILSANEALDVLINYRGERRDLVQFYLAYFLQHGRIEEYNGGFVLVRQHDDVSNKAVNYDSAFLRYKNLLKSAYLDKSIENMIRDNLTLLGDAWLTLDQPGSAERARKCYSMIGKNLDAANEKLGDFFVQSRRQQIDTAVMYYLGVYDQTVSRLVRMRTGEKILGLPTNSSANPAKLRALQDEIRGDLLFQEADDLLRQGNNIRDKETQTKLKEAAQQYRSIAAFEKLISVSLFDAVNQPNPHMDRALNDWEHACKIARDHKMALTNQLRQAPITGLRTKRTLAHDQCLANLEPLLFDFLDSINLDPAYKTRIAEIFRDYYQLPEEKNAQIAPYLSNSVSHFFYSLTSGISFLFFRSCNTGYTPIPQDVISLRRDSTSNHM